MSAEPSSSPIHEIPWSRLLPWLRLFRAPTNAADPRRLILAAIGIVLLDVGSRCVDRFVGAAGDLARPGVAATPGSWDLAPTPDSIGLLTQLAEPFVVLSEPFRAFFDPRTNGMALLSASLRGTWTVLVWGLFGGMIARSALLAVGRGERAHWSEFARFAREKVGPLLVTPLLPLVGVALVALPLGAFGLLYRVPHGWGATAASILGVVPLLGGVILALIVLILGVAWPLMYASIAAEREDTFDAMSRSYAYVHQRPWHLLGYLSLAAGLGSLGLLFARFFARTVVQLAVWSLSIGAPDASVQSLYLGAPGVVPPTAIAAQGFWLDAVRLMEHAWVYSYFWTVVSIIYLLLRLEVDGAPIASVAHEEPPNLLAEAAAGADPSVFLAPTTKREAASVGVPAPHATPPRDSEAVEES